MVIGGQKSQNEYPFYAQVWSLLDDEHKDERRFEFCGGALIADQWVLTAGHCVKDAHIATEVVLGQNNPEFPREKNPHPIHVCERIQHQDYHEGYGKIIPLNRIGAVIMAMAGYMIAMFLFKRFKGKTHSGLIAISAVIGFFAGFYGTDFIIHNEPTKNDIALLKLCKPVTGITPIEIIGETPDMVGLDVLLMGFGSETGEPQNDLREGKGKTITSGECSMRFLLHESAGFITPGAFCVESPDVFPCKGDSGSPAILDNKLLGLSSWGSRPCENNPSVYTLVPKYKNWINAIIS